jgi:outer membrane protein assembly factor BamE (lipoprotein component of BamABCDE complex)
MNYCSMTLRLFKLSALLFILIFTASCAPTVRNHGNFPKAEAVKKLQVGVSRRGDVREALGSPSSLSTFNDNTWYYISRKTSQVAFYDPKTLRQTVLAIKFDNTGVYRAAKAYSYKDGRRINPNDRKTPTTGREVTFLEQMFGNIGRFAGSGAQGNAPDLFGN